MFWLLWRKWFHFFSSFWAWQEEIIHTSGADESTSLRESAENEPEEFQRDNDDSSGDDDKETKQSKPGLKRGRKRKTKVEVDEKQESEPPPKRNKTDDGIGE